MNLDHPLHPMEKPWNPKEFPDQKPWATGDDQISEPSTVCILPRQGTNERSSKT